MSDIETTPRRILPKKRDLQEQEKLSLEASLHNLYYNQDILISLPPKIQKHVISFFPTYDLKECRLVSRTWNALLVRYMNFKVELSDTSRFTNFPSKSLEKLRVTTIITRNLSKLANPLNLQNFLHNFRMKSPKDVKKLVFRDNTSEECKNKLLEAYQGTLQHLIFLRIPLPPLNSPLSSSASNLSFPVLKTLEISTKSYNAGPEAPNFFRHARFPALKTLKLEFYARNNFAHYFGAHSFIVSHYNTLKVLTLSFGYYLSDLDAFSKRELNQPVDEETEMEHQSPQELAQIQKDRQVEYGALKNLLPLMKLEEIALNLSLNEGQAPWTLSFELLDSQRHLTKMEVQYPSVLKQYNFNHVIRKNYRTLRRISVPCMVNFDCSVLASCKNLQSFSIGREFSFNYLFFGNRGSLIHFQKFPVDVDTKVKQKQQVKATKSNTSKMKMKIKNIGKNGRREDNNSKSKTSLRQRMTNKLTSLSICVPLSKKEILWLSASLPYCHSLLLYGIEHEFFELEEVLQVLWDRHFGLKKLMMRIYMSGECSRELKRCFDSDDFIILTDFFHSDECGFTTFILNRSLQGEEEDKEAMAKAMDPHHPNPKSFYRGPGPSWGKVYDFSRPHNDQACSTENLLLPPTIIGEDETDGAENEDTDGPTLQNNMIKQK